MRIVLETDKITVVDHGYPMIVFFLLVPIAFIISTIFGFIDTEPFFIAVSAVMLFMFAAIWESRIAVFDATKKNCIIRRRSLRRIREKKIAFSSIDRIELITTINAIKFERTFSPVIRQVSIILNNTSSSRIIILKMHRRTKWVEGKDKELTQKLKELTGAPIDAKEVVPYIIYKPGQTWWWGVEDFDS